MINYFSLSVLQDNDAMNRRRVKHRHCSTSLFRYQSVAHLWHVLALLVSLLRGLFLGLLAKVHIMLMGLFSDILSQMERSVSIK